MQKTYTLFYLLLLCIALTSCASDWVTFAVDERISVRLPAQPQDVKASLAPDKTYMTSDPTGTYIISTATLTQDITGSDRDIYYKGSEEGFTHNGGKIVERSTFVVDATNGYEFEAVMPDPHTQEPKSIYVRVLIADKMAYLFQYIQTEADGRASKQTAKLFLNSITLKPRNHWKVGLGL
jgi:hypothetical protein